MPITAPTAVKCPLHLYKSASLTETGAPHTGTDCTWSGTWHRRGAYFRVVDYSKSSGWVVQLEHRATLTKLMIPLGPLNTSPNPLSQEIFSNTNHMLTCPISSSEYANWIIGFFPQTASPDFPYAFGTLNFSSLDVLLTPPSPLPPLSLHSRIESVSPFNQETKGSSLFLMHLKDWM